MARTRYLIFDPLHIEWYRSPYQRSNGIIIPDIEGRKHKLRTDYRMITWDQ